MLDIHILEFTFHHEEHINSIESVQKQYVIYLLNGRVNALSLRIDLPTLEVC